MSETRQTTGRALTIAIVDAHPYHDMCFPPPAPIKVAKVYSKGRVYACTFAEPFPTEADVRKLWRERRSAFQPYNETVGRYIRYC